MLDVMEDLIKAMNGNDVRCVMRLCKERMDDLGGDFWEEATKMAGGTWARGASDSAELERLADGGKEVESRKKPKTWAKVVTRYDDSKGHAGGVHGDWVRRKDMITRFNDLDDGELMLIGDREGVDFGPTKKFYLLRKDNEWPQLTVHLSDKLYGFPGCEAIVTGADTWSIVDRELIRIGNAAKAA